MREGKVLVVKLGKATGLPLDYKGVARGVAGL